MKPKPKLKLHAWDDEQKKENNKKVYSIQEITKKIYIYIKSGQTFQTSYNHFYIHVIEAKRLTSITGMLQMFSQKLSKWLGWMAGIL